MLLMSIINFIFAAVGMYLFQLNDFQGFGTFLASMMSVYRIETLDG